MKKEEIRNILSIAEKKLSKGIKCVDKTKEAHLNSCFNFLQSLKTSRLELIDKLLNSIVRFGDYYDANLSIEEQIKYFKENCFNDDDELVQLFILYIYLREVGVLISFSEVCDTYDELYDLLNEANYFDRLLYFINYLNEFENTNEPMLGFLDENNKYKILFSGFTYDDVKKLDSDGLKKFIRVLSGDLSKSDIVLDTERIGHIKDLFDVPLQRVKVSRDYRLTFIREKEVTVILGMVLKTGKNIDYNRYEAIARNINKIYSEIDLFLGGSLSLESVHYKVIEHLNKFIKNKKL